MRLSRFRVAAGWAAGALGLCLARPTLGSLAAGVPVALVGEVLRLWASGHLEKTRSLATGGPYAHTRNPLYLGSVLMALGLAIASSSLATALVAAAYLAAFYPAIIREEAEFLRGKFAPDYQAWASEVPAFLPRWSPGGRRSSRFGWDRVRANREWRSALTIPLIALLLYARGRWLPGV